MSHSHMIRQWLNEAFWPRGSDQKPSGASSSASAAAGVKVLNWQSPLKRCQQISMMNLCASWHYVGETLLIRLFGKRTLLIRLFDIVVIH